MHLSNVNVLADQTFSFYIDTDFSNNPEQLIYEIGESSTNDVYAINRSDWIEHPIFLRTTLVDFLVDTYSEWYSEPGISFFTNPTMEFLQTNYSDELNVEFHFLIAEDTIYTLDRRTNIFIITQIPLFIQNGKIANFVFKIGDAQTVVNNYQTIISVMTVATLLAAAMAGRLEERKISHKVSVLRADFKNDENLIIGQVDKFGLLVITAALILAVSALLFILVF